jgi:beta-glucosidase
VAANEEQAAALALNAGVDMEMVSRSFNQFGPQLLQQRKLSMATIDEAVRRILRIKFRLGLFDHPYTDETREPQSLLRPDSLALARQIAARSMVLLKNDRNLLPLDKQVKSIAVIGPLADDRRAPLGWWAGDGREENTITPLAGIRAKVGAQTQVRYAKGCEIKDDSTAGFSEAVALAKESDVALLFVGESADMVGEAASRSSLDLPGRQMDLVKAIRDTGKPTIVVLINGRPLTIGWIVETVPSILEAWMGGTQSGNAIADVLFGDVNPGGKLPVTFPRTVGQVPIYYNHLNTGRPPEAENRYTSKYQDVPWTPLFPFGYGLSYTQFKLSNLQLSAPRIQVEKLRVTVDVENVGPRTGEEVVQLYIRDPVASLARPVKELKDFKRVTLQAGEKRTVEFTLTRDQLAFWNREMRFVVEPGEFRVMVGTNSQDVLEAKFEVVER